MSVGSDDEEQMDLEELNQQTTAAPQENEHAVGSMEEGGEEDSGEQDQNEGMANVDARIHEFHTDVFEELQLAPAMRDELKASWRYFVASAATREAAGEALYTALYESSATMHSHFTTPRAVMAVKFLQGFNNIVNSIDDPPELKMVVETLSFSHLNFDITTPRISVFRDAICDHFALELGESFTTLAREAWCIVLNYVGGAFIYVRSTYSERFAILASSWAEANSKDKEVNLTDLEEQVGKDEFCNCGDDKQRPSLMWSHSSKRLGQEGLEQLQAKAEQANGSQASGSQALASGEAAKEFALLGSNTTVPQNFHDMFIFNAVVMGYGNELWMVDLLEHKHFEKLVLNVTNAHRFHEECDLMCICIHKYNMIPTLPHFKTVMLATMRSLVPQGWNSAHEAAWSWLWDSADRILKPQLGKPPLREQALKKMLNRMTDEQREQIRSSIFPTLFRRHPSAQDVFKTSTTRLYFITDRILSMTLELYKDPPGTTMYISALGLRHVGYGVKTDLFSPFVQTCLDVLHDAIGGDEEGEETFRFTLNLISTILVRTIQEGSTIVMRAINANSGKQINTAVSCAPRGERAAWVLSVQVGKQTISPLDWAIKNASLDAAGAILKDLLTIRADRNKYYYGMEMLFTTHPDIIKKLANDAPTLLPVLLDGLVWRSRTTEAGVRRVNYYVKHLMVAEDGSLNKSIEWIADHGDPKIACHPVVVLVMDMIWQRVARRSFLLSKTWLMFTLVLFIACQSVLDSVMPEGDFEHYCTASLRAFIYVVVMGQRIWSHTKKSIEDARAGRLSRVWGVPLPEHMSNRRGAVSLGLCLALIGMLCTEPVLHCISDPYGSGDPGHSGLFTEHCPGGEKIVLIYQTFSLVATLLYFSLLLDLAVLSPTVSAFSLSCGRSLEQLWLFLFSWFFVTTAFSAAIAAEEAEMADWANIYRCFLSFSEVMFRVYDKHEAERLTENAFLYVAVVLYCIIVTICAVNLLVAQLNCAYSTTYEDMLGFARLNRGSVIVEVMPSVQRKRWDRFVASLGLDKRCEFGVGDIGLQGGIQVLEPANLHPTTEDSIKRFGGTTSSDAPWPAEEGAKKDSEERLIRLEKTLEKMMRRVNKGGRHGGGGSMMGSSAWTAASSGSSKHSGGRGSASGSVHGGSDKS